MDEQHWRGRGHHQRQHRHAKLWKTNDFGDALYHFDAGLTTAVATRIELKLAYAYDYKTRPPSADIEKGDSALFAALLYKF